MGSVVLRLTYGSNTSLLEGLIKLVLIGEKIENGVFVLRSSQYCTSMCLNCLIKSHSPHFSTKSLILPKVIVCFFTGVIKSPVQ